MKFSTILTFTIALLLAVLARGELVMYTSTVETKGQDKGTLARATAPFSDFITNSCTSQDVSGYASRSGGTYTALWLSETGARCSVVDLQDFLIAQGLFNPIASTPVAAEKFNAKSCTQLDELTGYTYIKCGGCDVKGCNSAHTLMVVPLALFAIMVAMLF